ncbi:Hypothetical Protein FCC1311_054572 [Hondaea fermentalgiana]|uniref:Uncharacterized protein n=1 Tax=Hondaea fermentalgiana TaxID=2315210 RepID=A0A2R5GF88_9STRA|nr:Hypothetical Protein FCC1311_054572 [Hondaea fermentalgiana]|eukprot:GBG29235.1 Hypothetical Protein FCC1311_054572 [Hondaea fermentalgiana]
MRRDPSHGGIKVLLDSTVSFFESLTSTDSELIEVKLCEAGNISEETTFKFELDLSELPQDFLDSYDGEMFSVRHSLLVTVERPWYTFDVMRSMTVAIHSLSPAPAESPRKVDDDLSLPISPRSPASAASPDAATSPAAVNPVSDASINRIRVVDVYQGLSMIYASSALNLGDSIRGEITFGGGNPEDFKASLPPRKVLDITNLQVVLYKIEAGEGDSNEVIVYVHEVEVPGKKAPQEGSEDTGNAEIPQDANDGVVDPKTYVPPEPVKIPVEIPLVKSEKSGEFGPTIIKKNKDQSTSVSVRYYLRLVAIDAEATNFWNTHEIVLYRPSAGVEIA